MSSENRFIIAVDIGTTTLRTCVYDQECSLTFCNEKPISLIYGTEDDKLRVEMDPENLFSDLRMLVTESISKISDVNKIVGMGICCQRNTFLSWDKRTLKPLHNLVTWKDGRAIDECKQLNGSYRIKLLNLTGKIAYFFTRNQRYRAASFYQFLNGMVSHKFLYNLSRSIDMQQVLSEKQLQLVTLDAWLISKFTSGRSCFTEPSNVSSTGLFDPFLFDWGHVILKLFGFPLDVLPEIKRSAGEELCRIDKSVFGVEMPLLCLLGDSQAGLLGAACTEENMIKVSLGTGTFFNIISSKPYASLNGVYPLIGWSLPKPTGHSYTIESKANDTATAVNWAMSIGLCNNVEEASLFANEDAQSGLCFIPAFGGVHTPVEDNNACAGFLGLKPNTTKKHMMLAVVESVAFKVKQIWDTFTAQDLCSKCPTIRLCGGVSKNDFICQQISNLVGHPVERIEDPEFCCARGVALLAGVTAGIREFNDIAKAVKIDKKFEPEVNKELMNRYNYWLKANRRCLDFY